MGPVSNTGPQMFFQHVKFYILILLFAFFTSDFPAFYEPFISYI